MLCRASTIRQARPNDPEAQQSIECSLKTGWILSYHALATFPLTIFAGYAYLTERIFIFTMKCCTTHSTGTKRNPPRIVELARRLEPQGWIYDVPRSSLLNDEKQRSRTSLVSYASSGVFQLQGASK